MIVFEGLTGTVVDRINKMRKQLGDDYGQRLSYVTIRLKDDPHDYIPFDLTTLNKLLAEGEKQPLEENNRYIKCMPLKE